MKHNHGRLLEAGPLRELSKSIRLRLVTLTASAFIAVHNAKQDLKILDAMDELEFRHDMTVA